MPAPTQGRQRYRQRRAYVYMYTCVHIYARICANMLTLCVRVDAYYYVT